MDVRYSDGYCIPVVPLILSPLCFNSDVFADQTDELEPVVTKTKYGDSDEPKNQLRADHKEDKQLQPVKMKSNKNSFETEKTKKQLRADQNDAFKSVTLTAKDEEDEQQLKQLQQQLTNIEDKQLKQQLADIEAEMKSLIAQMK